MPGTARAKPPAAPTPPRRTKAEWMTPDVVNLAGTFSDRARINRYYPYAPYFNYEEPRPVFQNPDRELASNEEQANALSLIILKNPIAIFEKIKISRNYKWLARLEIWIADAQAISLSTFGASWYLLVLDFI